MYMYKERKLNTITNEDYFMSLYPSFFFLSSMKVSRLWLGSIVTNFTQVKVLNSNSYTFLLRI